MMLQTIIKWFLPKPPIEKNPLDMKHVFSIGYTNTVSELNVVVKLNKNYNIMSYKGKYLLQIPDGRFQDMKHLSFKHHYNSAHFSDCLVKDVLMIREFIQNTDKNILLGDENDTN